MGKQIIFYMDSDTEANFFEFLTLLHVARTTKSATSYKPLCWSIYGMKALFTTMHLSICGPAHGL